MVIVFDMRTGEVIEQSAPDPAGVQPYPSNQIELPRISGALQCVTQRAEQSTPRVSPAVLLGCYFDEIGD